MSRISNIYHDKICVKPPNILPEKDDLNVMSDGFDFLKKGIYKKLLSNQKKNWLYYIIFDKSYYTHKCLYTKCDV